MPRLSIVIPVQGSVDALERTLVSVLENRPPDSEIIVVLNTSYDDPYDLTDEVHFVAASAGADWAECTSIGFREARASVVHLLAAGVEVGKHWTQPALEHFRDVTVWAVAPATYDRCRREQLLNQSADVAPAVERPANAGPQPATCGPAWWGGFYRRASMEMSGGFDAQLSPAIGASELAWRQTLAGRRCVIESNSRLYAPADWTRAEYGFGTGYQAARYFWRRRADRQRKPSVVSQLMLIVAWLCTGAIRPSRWLHLAGTLAAWPNSRAFYREGQRLIAASLPASAADVQHRPHSLGTRAPLSSRTSGSLGAH